MVRAVTQLGPEMPVIPLMPIVKSNYTYNAALPRNGLDTAFWAGEHFPWNYYTAFRAATSNELQFRIPHNDGQGEDLVARVNKPTGEQTVINNESQYYVTEAERSLVTPELPQLSFINAAGNFESVCMRTPDRFKDYALGVINDYTISSTNQGANELVVAGKTYKWQEPSNTQPEVYGMQDECVGLDRFARDELTGDVNHGQSWKKQTYAYGYVIIKIPGRPDQKVRYDSVTEAEGRDPAPGASTSHTLHLLDTPAEWPSAGATMQLLRHMPYIGSMKTTQYTFSQKYHACHFKVKIPDHMRQFFAVFDWSNYAEVPAAGGKTSVAFQEVDKSAEADKIEYLSSPTRRFHNLHSPTGGMYNAAATSSPPRAPVIDHPEWTRETSMQHQILVPNTDPNNIVYGGNWIEIWTIWWPPGNPEGKPANSYEWYGLCPDGKFRRLGGCICPDHWDNGVLDPKLLFVNHAAYGDFTRGMDFVHDIGGGSAVDTDQWSVEMEFMDVYQHPGQLAGGMGLPARNGSYPNGFLPSPSSTTDTANTGRGRVNADATGFETGTGGVQDFDSTVQVVMEEIPILNARANTRHELSYKIVKNTLGYGINITFHTSIPNAHIEDNELVFDANMSGTFVDDVWLEYTEASGPGTAPIVGAEAVVTDPDQEVPDPVDPGTPIDPGDPGTGEYYITVVQSGPTVVANTNLPDGRGVFVDLPGTTNDINADVVNGQIVISDIPASFAGTDLRIYGTSGPELGDIEASDGYFTYASATSSGAITAPDYDEVLTSDTLTVTWVWGNRTPVAVNVTVLDDGVEIANVDLASSATTTDITVPENDGSVFDITLTLEYATGTDETLTTRANAAPAGVAHTTFDNTASQASFTFNAGDTTDLIPGSQVPISLDWVDPSGNRAGVVGISPLEANGVQVAFDSSNPPALPNNYLFTVPATGGNIVFQWGLTTEAAGLATITIPITLATTNYTEFDNAASQASFLFNNGTTTDLTPGTQVPISLDWVDPSGNRASDTGLIPLTANGANVAFDSSSPPALPNNYLYTVPSSSGSIVFQWGLTTEPEGPATITIPITVTAAAPGSLGPYPRLIPNAQGYTLNNAQVIGLTDVRIVNNISELIANVGPNRVLLLNWSGWQTTTQQLEFGYPGLAILGQFAPGQGAGITVGANAVNLSNWAGASGSVLQHFSMAPTDSGADGNIDASRTEIAPGGSGGSPALNSIMDHMHLYWGRDQIFSHWYNTADITYKDCIFGPTLDSMSSRGPTNGGGANKTVFYRCLIAGCTERNPLLQGHDMSVINSIINGWANEPLTFSDKDGAGTSGNVIKNLFVSGPNSNPANRGEVMLYAAPTHNHNVFLEGNIGARQTDPNGDQILLVSLAEAGVGYTATYSSADPNNWIAASRVGTDPIVAEIDANQLAASMYPDVGPTPNRRNAKIADIIAKCQAGTMTSDATGGVANLPAMSGGASRLDNARADKIGAALRAQIGMPDTDNGLVDTPAGSSWPWFFHAAQAAADAVS